jgi:hypothetical protein
MNTNEVSAWLRSFYSQPGNLPEVPNDDLGTTFTLCGAIVLASVLTSTRSPEQLAEITGLPITFTAMVIANMDFNQLWNSESFNELCRTIRVQPDDHEDVDDALECFLEVFWIKSKLPGMHEILPALRGVSLLFGKTQSWISTAE